MCLLWVVVCLGAAAVGGFPVGRASASSLVELRGVAAGESVGRWRRGFGERDGAGAGQVGPGGARGCVGRGGWGYLRNFKII